MTFIVYKTSDGSYKDDKKPCLNAYEGQIHMVDERTVDDPKKLRVDEDWYTDPKYKNHRVENGHIKRDRVTSTPVWFVDINSLEELMVFFKEYGQLIISKDISNAEKMTTLEIYDSWRE